MDNTNSVPDMGYQNYQQPTYGKYNPIGYGRGAFNKLKSKMPSFVNIKNLKKIIVVAVTIGVIYYIYLRIKDTVTNRPYLVKGEKSGMECLKVPGTRLRASKIGHEFTYSFWVYVDDWGHNFNKPKHLFHVGDKDGNHVCPGIWLYPKTNNLMVRVDTYSNNKKTMNPISDATLVKEESPCDLVNIPVQRWMHVAVVMINKTIDIYLNGKLTRSCTLENIPRLNTGDVHINMDGGFDGKISDLFYYNQAYSPADIYSVYNSGPNSFDLIKYVDDYIKAYSPKVNFKINTEISVGNTSLNLGTSTK